MAQGFDGEGHWVTARASYITTSQLGRSQTAHSYQLIRVRTRVIGESEWDGRSRRDVRDSKDLVNGDCFAMHFVHLSFWGFYGRRRPSIFDTVSVEIENKRRTYFWDLVTCFPVYPCPLVVRTGSHATKASLRCCILYRNERLIN